MHATIRMAHREYKSATSEPALHERRSFHSGNVVAESSLAPASGIKATRRAIERAIRSRSPIGYRLISVPSKCPADICAYTRGCGANSPARLGVALYIRLASVIIARRSDADNVTARACACSRCRTPHEPPPGG